MLAHIPMPRLTRLTLVIALPFILAAAQDRIHDPVDTARTVAVPGRHPAAIPANDRGLADPARELRYITLLLQPAAGLDEFLARQQNPGSPDYHRWLTPEQFADRFGLSTNDIARLTAWLQSAGLQVHDVARGRHWITFSGTVERLGRALHTDFHRYEVRGELHVAPSSDPSVPAAFAGVIAGFHGLDDFHEASALVQASAPATPQTTSGSSHYLAPDDFATIYDVKPLYAAGIDGTGVNIAVAGESDINIANMQQFRKFFNLPANDPEVRLYGPDPGFTGAETEADLDVEWAGAVARGAHIIYVNSTSVVNAVQYAIDQNLAPIITYSFIGCEQFEVTLRSIAQQANAQGITWMAASGDWGAATCDYIYSPIPQASLGPTVGAPASFPEVTALGGTQFNEGSSPSTYWASRNDANSASALGYIPEVVWNNSPLNSLKGVASGGPSAFFAKPSWQIGTPDDKVRDVPDVSLTAGTHDGYLVGTTSSLANGAFAVVGGTSASSPAFAGVVALLNQYLLKQNAIAQPGLGNINPTLYRLAQSTKDVFHDITGGNIDVMCVQGSPMCVNGKMGYAAAPGYDLATGLGTVDANNLITEWTTGTASQTALSADTSTAKPGATVHLTVTVTGGGKAVPTGAVTFVTREATIGSATLAPAADGSGASATVAMQSDLVIFNQSPVYALYSGDSVYSPSSGSTTVAADTSGGHSVVVPFISPNPVPQGPAGNWPYSVLLAEKAGMATKLTGFTINGADNSANIALFNKGSIPANGLVGANLVGNLGSSSLPLDRTFVFTGQDADGTTWTRQLTVTFVAAPGAYDVPAIGLAGAPSALQQNPQADPSCQWKQDLIIDEHAGFLMQLTKFTVGQADFSGQIQSIFGTTRLAPWGTLHGTMCWGSSNTVPGSSKTFTITGTATTGLSASASATVQYQAAVPGDPPSFTASSTGITLTVPDNTQNAGINVTLAFSTGSPSWQVSVLPANSTTAWLKVSPLSSTGVGSIAVQAVTSGLSEGAYQATLVISAPGALPDHIAIPVLLVVGASNYKISALVNAASFQPVAAPGMLAAVYAAGLNTPAQASNIPLPLSLTGLSATVNGISAPIWGIYPSSSQVNLQIPYEAGSGPAVLALNNNGAVSYYNFQIAAAAPGLFGIWDATGNPLTTVQQGQVVVAYITGDGDATPFVSTGATPAVTTAIKNLPKPRLPLSVSVGGLDVGPPLFYGIPSGFVGVTQINFTVPANAPLGPQPVVVTVGGVQSNAVTLTVTAPKP